MPEKQPYIVTASGGPVPVTFLVQRGVQKVTGLAGVTQSVQFWSYERIEVLTMHRQINSDNRALIFVRLKDGTEEAITIALPGYGVVAGLLELLGRRTGYLVEPEHEASFPTL